MRRPALAEMEPSFERLLVHFDVDTVDFTDLPLSENTGRNEGLPFDVAMRALGVLLGSEKLAAVTVTEFNPDHGEEDVSTARVLAECLARALTGAQTANEGNRSTTRLFERINLVVSCEVATRKVRGTRIVLLSLPRAIPAGQNPSEQRLRATSSRA